MKKKGKLLVKKSIWSKPHTEIWTGKKWQPCTNLQAARGYAETHGYSGIEVKMSSQLRKEKP